MAKKSLAEKRLDSRMAFPIPAREAGAPEYCVLQATSIEDLIAKHDELVEVGWRVKGGICVVSQYHKFNFFQAMTRKNAAEE